MSSLIVLLSGYAFSGKDAVADYIGEAYGGVKDFMSRPLDEALQLLDPLIPIGRQCWESMDIPSCLWAGSGLVDRHTDYVRYSFLCEHCNYSERKANLEVRKLLQRLGTEFGRERIHEDVWVDYIKRGPAWGRWCAVGVPFCITGVRYFNERDGFKNPALGPAVHVWVHRPGYGPVNAHSSDNTIGPEHCDVVMDNSGSLEDLWQVTETVLEAASRDNFPVGGRYSPERRAAELLH